LIETLAKRSLIQENEMSASSGFGLEEIGIPGRDYLREALTSCTDPLKAIEDFQVSNFTNIIQL
jgi:hypothetical protein